MNIPAQTKPAFWGAVAGAAATAFAGFTWAGWVTKGGAEIASANRADAAVVSALAPVCAANFRRSGDAAGNLVALQKTDSWSQGDFIEKGGWASDVGTKEAPDQLSAIAKACALLLVPA